MTTNPKKLMICADDFGISKNINLAIFKLAQKNRISAISCIVGPESDKKEFAELRNFKDQFLGLHFNLTHRYFSNGMKDQQNPGKSILSVYGDFVKNRCSRHQIEIEFIKQWDLFCDLVQKEPDYVDSHHHVHQLPLISDGVLNALERISHKPQFFVRNTENLNQFDSLFLKRAILNYFGQRLSKRLKSLNYSTNSNFVGFYDYFQGAFSFKIVESFLHRSQSDTLMMVHPSFGDTEDLNDLMKNSRASEFDILMSDEFINIIEDFGFEIELKSN